MIPNYIKIAWRNLQRNKIYSLLNSGGLAVGMACCILIGLFIENELSYDRYHKNFDAIYRVLHSYRQFQGGEKPAPPAPDEYQVWGNAPVGRALLNDFPEITKTAQFTSPVQLLMQYKENRFQESNLLFADSTTFDIFSWKLLSGSSQKALLEPNSIVLTQAMAKKYFGDENPLGQVLKVEDDIVFTVTGVMEDVPSNSHFSFDALISMSTFKTWEPEIFDSWGYVDFYTYFLVAPNTDISNLSAKIPEFLKRQHPGSENDTYDIAFEPLSNAYLYSKAGRQPGVTGSLSTIYIFSCIALFILVIACINFMNLSTARSVERAKEVGVRKTLGAKKDSLIYQFLTESILLSLIALAFAFVIALLTMPIINGVSGKALGYDDLLSVKMLLMLLCAALVVGILAGTYPAFVLTQFRPTSVLKGNFQSSTKGVFLRKGLVVFQFGLSFVLIVGTAVVFSQLDHLRSKKLGFTQEQMLVIDYGNDKFVNQKIEAVKTAFINRPDVITASASRAVPGDFFPNAYTTIQSANGEMQSNDPALYEIDFDFIPNYHINVVSGRAFSRDYPVDSTQSLMVNEAAAHLYGYANSQDIVGKRFDLWGRQGTVIGVVQDFNYQSLHHKVEPLVLRYAPLGALGKLSLHLKTTNLPETIDQLKRIWNQLAPQRPFLYSFLDESFNKQYEADIRFGQVFSIFSGLAILIACLGLFGLATYSTKKRFKEIGVRKVLGASIGAIVTLLSSDFIKLVLIAILIASPIAWWAMNKWLQNFAYHIEIQWWMFVLAGTLALAIALLTVSFQAIKAAIANPVDSLRDE